MTEAKIPPVVRRLQSIAANLGKAHAAGTKDAEAREDGLVLVEGISVAMAVRRLNQLAEDILADVEEAPPVFDEDKLPTLTAIAEECAQEFGVTRAAMFTGTRSSGRRATARHAYFFIARRLFQRRKSYTVMIRVIGLKDHSSAIHGFRTAASRYETDPAFFASIKAIEARLKGAA